MTFTPHHPTLSILHCYPLPHPPPLPPALKNFDRTLAGFDWTLWSQSIMGSPVIESTSSCPGQIFVWSTNSSPEHFQLSKVPTVVESTCSCREYLQLSRASPVVQSTSICQEHFHLSRAPPVVQSTSSCPKYLQLSRVPPVVESISSCPKYLHLSRTPPVVQSTSSCREHHQSEVSPLARSTSSCPKCLQLSRGPPIAGSISVCREQLSGVPRVVEGTSISRKYLHQPGARAVVQSTSTCREHLQLSKVHSVVESDICQTGSAIFPDNYRRYCGDSHSRYYDFSPFLLSETLDFRSLCGHPPLDPLQGPVLGTLQRPPDPQLARAMNDLCNP